MPNARIVTPVFIEIVEKKGSSYLNMMAVESIYIPNDSGDGPCVVTMRSGATHGVTDENSKLFELLNSSTHVQCELSNEE